MKRTLSMILSTIFLLKKSHCSRGIRMRSVAYLSQLFYIFVFLMTTLIQTQLASADFLVANGSATENAWVIYSTWRAASDGLPAGYRTSGWYKVEPGGFRDLSVPADNRSVYIRVEDPYGNEIEPLDHITRASYSFWMHPTRIFTAVETAAGRLLDSSLNQASLEKATLYKYTNEGIHIITKRTDCDLVGPVDLPAQEIYDQAINSVVWIHTEHTEGTGKGSGFLIDKDRKLIVTNQHVIDNAEQIYVFFPYRDQNGKLEKNSDFYWKNVKWLLGNDYATKGRVIAQNVENDLAIVQLDWLPSTAREIQHDFSRNLEDSMRRGDKVHILGNPGNRLWNWTQGTFLRQQQACPVGDAELVGCLEMEGDTHGGNSGGPVLNGQGVLIGVLSAGTDETLSLAATTRNIKALLGTLRWTLRIRNRTRVRVPYQMKWTHNDSWQNYSLESGYIRTHRSDEESLTQGFPKIRFDYIVGDNAVNYRTYRLDATLQSQDYNEDVPTYRFRYNWRGDRLDLYKDNAAAPFISSNVVPKNNALLANYPNPFNPETWIPYQLATPADVTLTIYAADGAVIRTLQLGNKPAGNYQSRSRSAYWDGKNNLGEPVASGVYFYTLTAGDFTATRKLLIQK